MITIDLIDEEMYLTGNLPGCPAAAGTGEMDEMDTRSEHMRDLTFDRHLGVDRPHPDNNLEAPLWSAVIRGQMQWFKQKTTSQTGQKIPGDPQV